MSNISNDPAITPPACEAIPLEKTRWFEDEVHTHDAMLKSYLRGSFPSVDAEDIAQESYLRTWLANATRPIRSAKAFLFTTARHLALNSTRREPKSPIIAMPDLAALDVADGRGDAAEAAATNEEIALLTDAFDSLPARCREIFVLRKIQDIPQREVAALFNITESAVEKQVHAGFLRLGEFFTKRGALKPWQAKT